MFKLPPPQDEAPQGKNTRGEIMVPFSIQLAEHLPCLLRVLWAQGPSCSLVSGQIWDLWPEAKVSDV